MASYPGELHRGGQVEGATLHLEGPGLRLVTDRGVTYRVAYKEMAVDITTDRALYVRTQRGDLAFSTHAVDCLDTLERRGALVEPQVRPNLQQAQLRHRSRRWVTRLVGVVFGVGLLLWLGPKVALYFLDYAPRSIDHHLGEEVFKELDLGPELDDPRILEPLQKILARLSPHAHAEDFELRLHVYDHPMINAFALPGGRMVVTTGLLNCAEEPEEVAAVLAHELAHVTRRHSLRSFVDRAGLMALAKLIASGDRPLVGTAAIGAVISLSLQHQREQELEADAVGVRTLFSADLDARSLSRILARMERENGGTVHIPEWAQTHPDTERRVAAIEAEADALGPKVGSTIQVDWIGLKRAAYAR